MIGSDAPLSAGGQKETFNNLISDALGEECDFNTIKTIHETLNEMIEESKDSPDPLVLTKSEVKRIFEESNIPDEKINIIEKQLTESVGEKPSFVAANISSGKKFNIETPDVVIKINPERTDLIQTKMVDGRQCLVIEVNERIEVNGVSVRTSPLPQDNENEY